jgi:hypothetical protein
MLKKTIFALFMISVTIVGLQLVANKATVTAESYDSVKSVCDAAGNKGSVCGNQGTSGKDPVTGKGGAIDVAANIISWAAGAIAVIVIIFAGFRFTTSGGDSGKVSSARNTIIYAAIGLLVIVLARVIVSFVIGNIN